MDHEHGTDHGHKWQFSAKHSHLIAITITITVILSKFHGECSFFSPLFSLALNEQIKIEYNLKVSCSFIANIDSMAQTMAAQIDAALLDHLDHEFAMTISK